jgi:hypothetical protein
VVDGAISNNVKIILVDTMVLYVVWFKKQWHQSLLHLESMVSWLINVFQGVRIRFCYPDLVINDLKGWKCKQIIKLNMSFNLLFNLTCIIDLAS